MQLKYIGDVSQQDAEVLATWSKKAQRVLEFGVGGSTQIIAQSALSEATLFSVDTEPGWIAKTQRNIEGLRKKLPMIPVNFLTHQEWRAKAKGPFDLIFNDGLRHLRFEFAQQSWPLLRVGGWYLVHDQRRSDDIDDTMRFLKEKYLEVDQVLVNTENSNITAIRKAEPKRYIDWNKAEGRQSWQVGQGEAPASFFE